MHDFGKPHCITTDEKGINHFYGHPEKSEEIAGAIMHRLKFDNDTLRRLMVNEKAMEALMRIEGFRALNKDIETIINKSEHVKKAKREGESLSKKEKTELTAEEKNAISHRGKALEIFKEKLEDYLK